MTKTALVTGITGQDGAYLARLLLEKGYQVHGLHRRSSVHNTERIDDIIGDIALHSGDLTDGGNLFRLIHDTQPDEIYNLAAQSHVGISFDTPEYTANTDALGCLRLLEALRTLDSKARFYQASSSELFGNADQSPQNENTPFRPCSPYAVAKLYAYWTTVNYREAYGMHASNGILFNHESPMRGEDFVTQKVVQAVANGETLRLGNIYAKRDWGHARDYVEGMWLMLQQDKPDDYVLATGETYRVKDFVERAYAHIGIALAWRGEGMDEQGYDPKTDKVWVSIDPNLYRPQDVDALCGDAAKARKGLGWSPRMGFDGLVQDMMDSALREKPYAA